MKPLRVCVTGVGGGGLGEQLIKALRLAETDYFIVGTDTTRASAGLTRVDAAELLPLARDPGYLEGLLDLCRRHDVRAVLPGSEPELRVLANHAEVLAAEEIFLPVNPAALVELCLDKNHLSTALRGLDPELGITVPWSARMQSPEDAEAIPEFPVVFKPSVGSGGSANVYIAQNPEEARWFARYLCALYPEFIAQAYVGVPEHEYTVGVLTDMHGELIHSIAVRRHVLSSLGCRLKLPNRSGRHDLGSQLVISSGISQGDIGPFPEVTAPCEELARILGSRGPFNIQCRLVGGKVYVFEINPRFSGTTSLRALAGFNEPDQLIRRHVLGQDPPRRFSYRTGVILRRLEESFVENS